MHTLQFSILIKTLFRLEVSFSNAGESSNKELDASSQPACHHGDKNNSMYIYRIAGKFGELSVIRQTKTIQIFTYNYYLMAESIHSPNFSSQNTHNSEFAKLSHCQTFPLYGIYIYIIYII